MAQGLIRPRATCAPRHSSEDWVKAILLALLLVPMTAWADQAEDANVTLAMCKIESLQISEPLALQYVRLCMDAKHYDFTPMPEGCHVYGQAVGSTGGYTDKRSAVNDTTVECFRKRTN
jgi:hypothetical protein